MSAYFLSDLHLRGGQSQKALALLAFLETIYSRTEPDQNSQSNLRNISPSNLAVGPTTEPAIAIFFVGDIFDLWLSDHTYFVDEYRDILSMLINLKARGVRLVFFEGNHDLFLEPYFEQVLKAEVYRTPQYFKLGSSTVRVEHGDLINPDDKGYLRLKSFLHLRATEWLGHHLPGRVVRWIGERLSRASRDYTSLRKSIDQNSVRTLIQSYALHAFKERPFDVIITGHVHLRDRQMILVYSAPNLKVDSTESHKIESINLGSWFDVYMVLEFDGHQFEFCTVAPATF